MSSNYAPCVHCNIQTMAHKLSEGYCHRCLFHKSMNQRQEQVNIDQMNTQAAASGKIMMMGRMIMLLPDSDPQKQVLQQMFMQLMEAPA